MTAPADDLTAQIRDAIAAELGKVYGVPMDMIDGRPWVPTHDEAHPPEVFGRNPCRHADCPGSGPAVPRGLLADLTQKGTP